MDKPVVLLGMGGHARVLLDAMHLCGMEVLGYTSPVIAESQQEIPYLGDDQALVGEYASDKVHLVNGLGSVGCTKARRTVFEQMKGEGFGFAAVIHPSAMMSTRAKLGEGAQIMAGAVVQTGVACGDNVLINTGATVDHDSVIGAHSHVSVGVTVSGEVRIGDSVHVGAGSTLIQGVEVGADSVVAAGAVVIRDVKAESMVVGVPAQEMKP